MSQDTERPSVAVKLRSFSRSLPMSLLMAREAVMNRFRPALHLFNITEQQWRVLRALTTVAEIEVTTLAKATCLLAPSLSRILKDLEARNLIIRRSAATDMRKSLIAISPNGLRLIEGVAPYSEAIYSEITDAFSDERLGQLQDLLKELTVVTNALPPMEHGAALLPEVHEFAQFRPRGRPRKRQEDGA